MSGKMKTLNEFLTNGKITNSLQVYGVAYQQAEDELGANIAYWFISERRSGRELSQEEKVMYIKIQCETYRDRARQIIESCYDLIPVGVKKSRLMREYISCQKHSL